ncbi:hypothetical protein PT2222_150256 [Paraburkholderia tropica]
MHGRQQQDPFERLTGGEPGLRIVDAGCDAQQQRRARRKFAMRGGHAAAEVEGSNRGCHERPGEIEQRAESGCIDRHPVVGVARVDPLREFAPEARIGELLLVGFGDEVGDRVAGRGGAHARNLDAFRARGVHQVLLDHGVDGIGRERMTRGHSLGNRVQQRRQFRRGDALTQQADFGQQIGIGARRKEGDRVSHAEARDRHAKIEERRTATDDEFPVVRVHDGQRPQSVRAEHHAVRAGDEAPRLAVVARRRERRMTHGEAQRELVRDVGGAVAGRMGGIDCGWRVLHGGLPSGRHVGVLGAPPCDCISVRHQQRNRHGFEQVVRHAAQYALEVARVRVSTGHDHVGVQRARAVQQRRSGLDARFARAFVKRRADVVQVQPCGGIFRFRCRAYARRAGPRRDHFDRYAIGALQKRQGVGRGARRGAAAVPGDQDVASERRKAAGMRDHDGGSRGRHQEVHDEAAGRVERGVAVLALSEHEQVGVTRVQRRGRRVARLQRAPFDHPARPRARFEELRVRVLTAMLGHGPVARRRRARMRHRQIQPDEMRVEALRQIERIGLAGLASRRIVEVDEQSLVAHDVFPGGDARLARSVRHQHRYRHRAEHCLRDAAEQQLFPARMAVGAHHDQIAAGLAGACEQGVADRDGRRRMQFRDLHIQPVTREHQPDVGTRNAVFFLAREREGHEFGVLCEAHERQRIEQRARGRLIRVPCDHHALAHGGKAAFVRDPQDRSTGAQCHARLQPVGERRVGVVGAALAEHDQIGEAGAHQQLVLCVRGRAPVALESGFGEAAEEVMFERAAARLVFMLALRPVFGVQNECIRHVVLLHGRREKRAYVGAVTLCDAQRDVEALAGALAFVKVNQNVAVLHVGRSAVKGTPKRCLVRLSLGADVGLELI